jgi:hypothetical protein
MPESRCTQADTTETTISSKTKRAASADYGRLPAGSVQPASAALDRLALVIESADEDRFVSNSSLEETGFEPSVPRDTTKVFERSSCRLCLIPASGRVAAKRESARR